MGNASVWRRLDGWLILFYAFFICWGWANLYSTALGERHAPLFDLSENYAKQLLWMGLSALLILVITLLKYIEYYQFAGVVYLISIALLAGLFPFGRHIHGAVSWYALGPLRFQPAELAKLATALLLARYLSDPSVEISRPKALIRALLIIGVPTALIAAQPDLGTALVFSIFLLVLYRESMPGYYLFIGFGAALIFVMAQAFGATPVLVGLISLASIWAYQRRRQKKNLWRVIPFLVFAIGFLYSTDFIFNRVLSDRHRNRINILIGKVEHTEAFRRGIGYNLNQSLLTIGSGGLMGKGFLKGTLTQGNFVPEQSTDYIFCTIGEEWGFVGSAGLVILFSLFIARIFYKAERQNTRFSRVYGYAVGCFFMIHLLVNAGMALGIMPTIGIPLPFFSYGGSALWGFTAMLFIFIKLDATRGEFF